MSSTNMMIVSQGDDCVVVCKHFKNGTFSIEHYYNREYQPEVLYKPKVSIGLTSPKLKYDNGTLTFSFLRLKSKPEIENYFDLNNKFYILMAKGLLNNDGR